MRRALALVLATPLVLPPPAAAETALGGYSASAEAAVVRVGIYEPAVPIPAEPQIDASIGFARATTATGPSARGLASYLWPGDAVGDGLGVLLGDESLDYPVKTSSSYPATDTSPAENAVQITAGNGMRTSADGTTTRAKVTGLGLGNGVGEPGKGLCQLLKKCPDEETKVDLPDPLAAVATIENLTSDSSVVLGEKTVTATAHTAASGISVLGGLVTVEAMDLRSRSASDGTKGSAEGTTTITGLRVLGQRVALGSDGLGGAPTVPQGLPPLLEQLGLGIDYVRHHESEKGQAGALSAEGLTITLDVAPLRALLGEDTLPALLAPLLTDVDQAGPVLLGLLKLGTKIVITVGDVRTRATASPSYEGPVVPSSEPPTAPVAGGGTGAVVPGLAPPPGLALGQPTPGVVPVVTAVPPTIEIPGLGEVPAWFVLLGLALVGLAAWGTRGFGTWIFGAGSCGHGSAVGVPDLRKVRSS